MTWQRIAAKIPYNRKPGIMMIEWILLLAGLYLAIGTVFAVAFHAKGIARVDSGAVGAGLFFRLLVTPGIVALWPVLLGKWRRRRSEEDVSGSAETPVSPGGLRSAHRFVVTALALGLPPLVAAGLWLRPAAILSAESGISSVPPLPAELLRLEAPSQEFPVRAVLRGGAGGTRQIELEIDRDLAIPTLALFAAPEDGPGVPPASVFVGSVHGPGILRYDLPKRQRGTLVFYSLAQGRRVASWEYSIAYSTPDEGGS